MRKATRGALIGIVAVPCYYVIHGFQIEQAAKHCVIMISDPVVIFNSCAYPRNDVAIFYPVNVVNCFKIEISIVKGDQSHRDFGHHDGRHCYRNRELIQGWRRFVPARDRTRLHISADIEGWKAPSVFEINDSTQGTPDNQGRNVDVVDADPWPINWDGNIRFLQSFLPLQSNDKQKNTIPT
jgi:hypothetical protein